MRAPRFQMSLRFLLVGVTVIGVGLGIVAERARRQRELQRRLAEVGAAVLFDYQRLGASADSDFNPRAEPPAPEWLRRLLGEEFFRTVIYVNMIGQEVGDERRAGLRLGESIEYLILDSSSIGDAAMADVAQCHRLAVLSLDDTQITDAGLEQLAGLRRLQYLSVSHTAITDKGLYRAIELPSLRELHVMETAVTPAAIENCKRRFPQVEIRHD